MKPKPFPYQEFENLPVWKIIEKAVDDLVQNGDLLEQTARGYIVGYVIKQMDDKGMLAAQALRK